MLGRAVAEKSATLCLQSVRSIHRKSDNICTPEEKGVKRFYFVKYARDKKKSQWNLSRGLVNRILCRGSEKANGTREKRKTKKQQMKHLN